MFKLPKEKTETEKQLTLLFEELRTLDVTDEKYDATLDKIAKLHKLVLAERDKGVSADTLVLAATNLLGIVLVLNYERLGVVTSRAFGQIQRPR